MSFRREQMKFARVEFFEASRNARHAWYWRLKARNGQVIAVGGEGYTRRRDVERAFWRVWSILQGRF